MKFSSIHKFIFTCIIFALFLFNANICFASDYKYKVLDPKYNPEAEQLIAGKLPSIRTMPPDTRKGFDIGTFLAIFALVTFPIGIIYIAVKTFNEVMQPYNETAAPEKAEIPQENIEEHEQVIGNIKITPEKNTTKRPEQTKRKNPKPTANKNYTAPKTAAPTDTKKIPNTFIKKYFTSPIAQIPNPMLLYTSPLSSNKGFCLVEYNQKYSLIGYINDEIFLLNQFDKVKTCEIRSRISETRQSSERYIVRLGNYKALVEVTDQKMELLIDL